MRQPLRKLFDRHVPFRAGQCAPDDFTFEFNPLWQMSDVDRSTVATNTVNAIVAAVDAGLMTVKAGMTDLRENADVTGVGASITDEDIENAEDEAKRQRTANGLTTRSLPKRGGDPVPDQPTQDSRFRLSVNIGKSGKFR